jgi:hypothetical protein
MWIACGTLYVNLLIGNYVRESLNPHAAFNKTLTHLGTLAPPAIALLLLNKYVI